MTVVLHNIRSAHNVGSIFRTADAAGFEKVYLCGITPGPLDRFGRENSRVTKVSLDSEKYLVWEQAVETTELLDKLKATGAFVLCVEQSKGSTPLGSLGLSKDQQKRGVVVMGDEVRGLSPEILKRADKIIEIPMHGKKESLNVSVAFGIVAYSLIA